MVAFLWFLSLVGTLLTCFGLLAVFEKRVPWGEVFKPLLPGLAMMATSAYFLHL